MVTCVQICRFLARKLTYSLLFYCSNAHHLGFHSVINHSDPNTDPTQYEISNYNPLNVWPLHPLLLYREVPHFPPPPITPQIILKSKVISVSCFQESFHRLTKRVVQIDTVVTQNNSALDWSLHGHHPRYTLHKRECTVINTSSIAARAIYNWASKGVWVWH